jgi:hypothetical protein
MSEPVLERRPPAETQSKLPGAQILRRMQQLLTWTLGALVVYSVGMVASRGGNIGSDTGTGGYLDAAGHPTSVAPVVYDLVLHPSPLVYLAIGLTIVLTIPRVLRTAQSEMAAIRVIDHAMIAVVAIVLGSLAIGMTWFFLMPIDQTGHMQYAFFPFGTIERVTEPVK